MQVGLQKGFYMIQGNATKDAERKVVGEKNTIITEFSLAIGKNEDGSSIFANCKSFGRLADYAQFIKKADSVLCVGRVEEREYNGKTYKDFICDWVNFAALTVIPEPFASMSPELLEGSVITQDVSEDDLPF